MTEDTRALIGEARARLTTSRLGKSMFREMDKDLVVIKRLVDALEADREPGTVTDEMVEAAAIAIRAHVNVCGDDRGCECEDAESTSGLIARAVLKAAEEARP